MKAKTIIFCPEFTPSYRHAFTPFLRLFVSSSFRPFVFLTPHASCLTPFFPPIQNIAYIWETLAFTGMDKQQRHKILESVMWDYSISAAEMEELLDGKIDKAGHYTREQLFARMLTGLPWFTIIRLVPVEKVRTLLTDNVIGILWPESIRKKYEYVRKRLQEALPDAG